MRQLLRSLELVLDFANRFLQAIEVEHTHDLDAVEDSGREGLFIFCFLKLSRGTLIGLADRTSSLGIAEPRTTIKGVADGFTGVAGSG